MKPGGTKKIIFPAPSPGFWAFQERSTATQTLARPVRKSASAKSAGFPAKRICPKVTRTASAAITTAM